MNCLAVPALVVLFFVVWLVLVSRKLGPNSVDAAALGQATVLLDSQTSPEKAVWSELGSATTARGLDLKFEADDDPQASASLIAPSHPAHKLKNTHANNKTVDLGSDFETHHVHGGGFVFRITLRGTGAAVGKQVRIQMMIDRRKRPVGGCVQNDDDLDFAIGDWIETSRVELLQLSKN